MKSPRLMLIGLDSLSLSLFDRFAAHCPTVTRFMREAVSGRAIPSFPVYTPTNWAVLATGADSSTTGAEGWHNDDSGRRLSTFDRRAVGCDNIFDAAARAGLTTLAMCYPGAHPAGSPRNLVLAPLDRGLVSNCLVPGKILPIEPDPDGVFRFAAVEPPEKAGGAAMAKRVGATEDGAKLGEDIRKAASEHVRGELVRIDRGWALTVKGRGAGRKYVLEPDRWSDPIPVRVSVPGRPGKCLFRVMVFDRGRRLAVSEAYDVGALGRPAGLVRRILDELGPPTEHSVFYSQAGRDFAAGREDRAVLERERADLEAQADWIADAAALAMREQPYDVFYLHYHYPDSVLHTYLASAEGGDGSPPLQRRRALRAMGQCFEICDRLVKRLLALAGKDTTVLLVSDHGNVPNRYGVNLRARLVETGLTVLDAEGNVDKKKSLATVSARVGTWIDVHARPGTARYEELQARVLDALLDWKTDEGERVVAVALRRKDSHLLGYYGPHCADVTFHYNSGFSWAGCPAGATVAPAPKGANHGPQMPATFSKISDNLAFFMLRGPGTRRGVRWQEADGAPVRLVDLVPTICHLSGVPTPRNVCGAVRRDFLKTAARGRGKEGPAKPAGCLCKRVKR